MEQEVLINREQEALRLIRAYDRDAASLEEAVEAILAYSRLFTWDDRQAVDKNERALEITKANLIRTLTDKPWKNCGCNVCGSASVEAIIFHPREQSSALAHSAHQ